MLQEFHLEPFPRCYHFDRRIKIAHMYIIILDQVQQSLIMNEALMRESQHQCVTHFCTSENNWLAGNNN